VAFRFVFFQCVAFRFILFSACSLRVMEVQLRGVGKELRMRDLIKVKITVQMRVAEEKMFL
jgi:hypothetical protein